MTARALHSRDDLIDVIRGRCILTSCNRAIDSGVVSVLGGFAPSERISKAPHWVVQIRSRNNRVWILSVKPRVEGYSIRQISYVPWLYWSGDGAGEPGVYNGDDPAYCNRMKLTAMENKDGGETN